MDSELRELRRQAVDLDDPQAAARWAAALARRDGDPIRRLRALAVKVTRETRPFRLPAQKIKETIKAATRTKGPHVSWRASHRQTAAPGRGTQQHSFVSHSDKFAQCPYVIAYQHVPLGLVIVAIGKALAHDPRPEQAWPELKGRYVDGWWDKLQAWAFEESEDRVVMTREQALAFVNPKPKPVAKEDKALGELLSILAAFPGGKK